ncbi:MAG TPA: response regulator [Holophagaceae bacterium]|nr:response regulator [Holophagaceae bacterium]
MPRLLLVDDNPSIHRIAESLLVGSSVELVCVDSAEQAMQKLDAGEAFDIALLDTVMPGMDGWQLLDRIRANPTTARMPVAMMAGVLDPVDPGRLDTAPIQGFLKKPIELRDLNDRVQSILAQSGQSPFATVPGSKLEGWSSGDRDVSMFDVPAFEPEAQASESEGDSDLLILRAEDLLEVEEEAAPPPVPALHAAPDLVLDELDVEGLKALHPPAPAAMMELPPMPVAELPPMPVMEPAPAGIAAIPGEEPRILAPLEPVAPAAPIEEAKGMEELGLGDLGELAEPALPAIQSVDLGTMGHGAEEPSAPAFAAPSLATFTAPSIPAPPPVPAPVPLPAEGGLDPEVLAKAIAADPALLDALVKAVISRAGDKVLREIAWELMPDLAAKLKH